MQSAPLQSFGSTRYRWSLQAWVVSLCSLGAPSLWKWAWTSSGDLWPGAAPSAPEEALSFLASSSVVLAWQPWSGLSSEGLGGALVDEGSVLDSCRRCRLHHHHHLKKRKKTRKMMNQKTRTMRMSCLIWIPLEWFPEKWTYRKWWEHNVWCKLVFLTRSLAFFGGILTNIFLGRPRGRFPLLRIKSSRSCSLRMDKTFGKNYKNEWLAMLHFNYVNHTVLAIIKLYYIWLLLGY